MGTTARYEIIWEFTVAEEHRTAFEAAYSTTGDWAKLFQKGKGYLETRLLRDENRGNVYLTIDRWASREDFRRFQAAFTAEYRELDQWLEGIAGVERCIGTYDAVLS